MLLALSPAISLVDVTPGSAGGWFPHAGATVGAGLLCGGASPSTTRNCTAFGLRLAFRVASEYASWNTQLYASAKSPPPPADMVLIAVCTTAQLDVTVGVRIN